MRKADIFNFNIRAGQLLEIEKGKKYVFRYDDVYTGPSVSLTLPLVQKEFEFNSFPPFFEGLLPEGVQLDALLRKAKIDSNDYFGILCMTGKDLVGSVTVVESE